MARISVRGFARYARICSPATQPVPITATPRSFMNPPPLSQKREYPLRLLLMTYLEVPFYDIVTNDSRTGFSRPVVRNTIQETATFSPSAMPAPQRKLGMIFCPRIGGE